MKYKIIRACIKNAENVKLYKGITLDVFYNYSELFYNKNLDDYIETVEFFENKNAALAALKKYSSTVHNGEVTEYFLIKKNEDGPFCFLKHAGGLLEKGDGTDSELLELKDLSLNFIKKC